MAFATLANAQNLLSDGTFTSTAAGNFTLQTTTGTVNIAVTRNIWGGVDHNASTSPTMGVTTGGYTGNCGFFTVGSAAGSYSSVYLYQRLSATPGMNPSKTYKLTFKAKSTTARSGFFYIKNRGTTKFALRADWNYGASDTYGWCIYRSAIPTTWTEYSQTFVFSNSISGNPISSTQPPALASAVPFTDAELNDLIVGFYSNTTSAGTVYIDDVVFEEAIATPTANAASAVDKYSFTANWAAVTGAASYQLDVSTNNTFTAILSSYNNLSVSGTSQVVSTGLADNTTYYYRVRAVSNAGTVTSNSSTISTTTLSDPSLVKDGSFTSASSGNFTLGSAGTVNISYTRNTWGGINYNTGDAALPVMGVTSGGYSGNCGFFTRGTTQPYVTTTYLFQRLSATPGMSATKTYKLSMKLKSGATASNGLFYIRNRAATKYALRDNIISGGADTYTWCKATGTIPATWTDYSQSFIFSNSLSGSVISTTQPSLPEVAFTDAELNDLVVCFYSTTSNGTVYIDDVTLEENTIPTIFGGAIATAFTTTYGTVSSKQDFPVAGRYLSSDITATAPTGFEVASDGATYSSTATIAQSGGNASGTINVRLKANANVSGTYNSQNIVLSSTNATSVNIATSASGNAVTAKALTIGAASIASKVYDGSATSGTVTPGSLSGFAGSETVTVSSAVGTYPDANVGTGKTATIVYTLGNGDNGGLAANYSLANGSTTGDITAISAPISTDSNLGNAATLPGTDVSVAAGKVLTVDYNTTVRSITVAPGAKLTLSNGLTATNGITLESDENGTATILQSGNLTGNVIAKQYLGSARNWYVSSPVSSAGAPATNVDYYYEYVEGGNNTVELRAGQPGSPTDYWKGLSNGTTMEVGKGYIAKTTAGTTVQFSGTPNNGDITTIFNLTRNDSKGKGFNLVGNPYPSYIDWVDVAAANSYLDNTYYYRTKNSASGYTFVTWNGAGSNYVVSNGSLPVNTTVTRYIPPTQAFWVRVKNGTSSTTMNFTNTMREHRDDNGNLMKAKRQDTRISVRLQLQNGTEADELLIYQDEAASNSYDAFDSPKMMNNSSIVPDLYSKVGDERLVINGLNSIADNMELPLGFTLKAAANGLKLKVSELNNFESGTKVYLLDKEQSMQTELLPATEYTFNTIASTTNNESRFSLLFRAPGSTTGVENTAKLNTQVFVNANNQITIIAPEKASYSIYNAMGQMIENGITTSNYQTSNIKLAAGVYVVKVANVSKRIIIK